MTETVAEPRPVRWGLAAKLFAILLLLANIVIVVGCNRIVERRYAEVFR